MKVSLVAVSQPTIPTLRNAEDLIVYCARVSNPANQSNVGTGAGLLAFCIRNGHWSVFETASMTVEIQTSRAIAAQILRHRSFTFQEFSQRYSVASELEPISFRQQGVTNRQAGDVPVDLTPDIQKQLDSHLAKSLSLYNELIGSGIARECARMVLPLCTKTTLYMTGSVRSWIHYLQQRTSPHSQKEHRDVADRVQAIFDSTFPTISRALNEKTQ